MTTAEDYKEISDRAYGVDPLKADPPLAAGSLVKNSDSGQGFLITKTATDPVTGFQGMAVVPVVAGAPDYSQLVVAYAGTNFDHRADELADAESVLGGATGWGTQAEEAMRFAQDARAEAAKENGGPVTVSTTGHSLGGYLALLVAAENGWSATTFNGPDPWDDLSPEARKRLKEQRAAGEHPLVNYVNEWDVVGNLKGDGTGAAVYVGDSPGRDPLDYHNLDDAFRFDERDGSVIGAGVRGRSDEEIIGSLVSKVPGGAALIPVLDGVLEVLRSPEAGRALAMGLTGLAVAVDTVAALGLAASIAGTTEFLRAIKSINGGLVEQMEAALQRAMSAAYVFPFVHEQDIVNCVHQHRLWVHQNIDEHAVAEVDRLVDDHIVTVAALASGVRQSVQHAIDQDGQWALAFADR